ncbi:hypothetical protein CBL_01985 [Carabus blaptoides fortunei]
MRFQEIRFPQDESLIMRLEVGKESEGVVSSLIAASSNSTLERYSNTKPLTLIPVREMFPRCYLEVKFISQHALNVAATDLKVINVLIYRFLCNYKVLMSGHAI